MIKKLLYLSFAMLSLFSCREESDAIQPILNPLDYVDPFIGTGGHGHTFPGATRPNAMVQFSPDTHLLGWEASSGYHNSDSIIYGFSLTHLSGTGIGDLGDVSILPYSNYIGFGIGADSSSPLAHFEKSSEKASAGYYAVDLDEQRVKVELTSSERVGLMRATYQNTQSRKLALDLFKVLQRNWGHTVVKNDLTLLNDSTVLGTYYTKGWAEHHQMSYCLRLSQPASKMILESGSAVHHIDNLPHVIKDAEASLILHLELPEGNEPLLYKVGLSAVSPEQAMKNLEAELPHWDFDKVKKESAKIWRKTLGAIKIKSDDPKVMTNFYTALYHSFIAPFNYQDVDGTYRGIDKQVHKSDSTKGHYTVFSIWDTYRALHPLLTIINPKQAQAYGHSLIKDYQEGTILPRWPLASNYTGCMPAYHSVSILADLVCKDLANKDDLKLWTEACLKSSGYREDLAQKFKGTRELDLITKHPYFKEKLGFIPADSLPESVSWGVEMAYDDWCIARIAEAGGLDSIAKAFDEKGKYYQRYWCPDYRLMRPLMADGSFRTPFNPRYSAHQKSDYTEGNAYQWSFYAPHDMENFIELMGGKEVLEANLDTLFTTSSRIDGAEQSGDITGLIGQYAHGNEPSHHIAYLYNWTSAPEKGQAILDSILTTFYTPTPDGIIGNEDCGQMSAWYVMSALGFYQVCPGKAVYSIGRPLVKEARIQLKNGAFRIVVKNNKPENKYIRSAKINGRDISKTLSFKHKDIKAGGLLEITMDKTPKPKAQQKK